MGNNFQLPCSSHKRIVSLVEKSLYGQLLSIGHLSSRTQQVPIGHLSPH